MNQGNLIDHFFELRNLSGRLPDHGQTKKMFFVPYCKYPFYKNFYLEWYKGEYIKLTEEQVEQMKQQHIKICKRKPDNV